MSKKINKLKNHVIFFIFKYLFSNERGMTLGDDMVACLYIQKTKK